MDVDESFNCESTLEDIKFKCNLCVNEFENKDSIMRHKKDCHSATVPTCDKFSKANCTRSDIQCWYKHTKQKSREENLQQQQRSSVKQQQDFQEASENPFPPDLLMKKMMESMNRLCMKVEIMEKRMEELMN